MTVMQMNTIIRSLEEQFESGVAEKLRIIQTALLSFRVEQRTSSYYLFEIARAIEGGILLAALELSTTLLEIWIRDLLVIRRATQQKITSRHHLLLILTKIDREIEGVERGIGFGKMVKELSELEVLDKSEIIWLNSVYSETRNSLHHGLSGRLLDPKMVNTELLNASGSRGDVLMASIFCSMPTHRSVKFEEYIDNKAIEVLESLVNFLANHPIPKGG